MRKVFLYLVAVALFAGCSVDEIVKELSPEMTATIDGTPWQANLQYTQLEDGKFIITGTALNGQTLVITTIGTAEGTYELNLTSAKCAAVYKETANTNTEDAYLGVTGTVVISDINSNPKAISGTFTFTVTRGLEDIISITEGKFKDLKYTEGE
jgi:hypothetical protein